MEPKSPANSLVTIVTALPRFHSKAFTEIELIACGEGGSQTYPQTGRHAASALR